MAGIPLRPGPGDVCQLRAGPSLLSPPLPRRASSYEGALSPQRGYLESAGSLPPHGQAGAQAHPAGREKELHRYSRKIIEKGAFLDFKKVQGVSKTGSTEVNSFLLVIPCSEIPVAVGDKVLHGNGPEIASREDWAGLIPPMVPELVAVKWVDPKYWKGRLVHVEAGG